MKWATTTRHQASIVVDGDVFNVMCESDMEDDFALMINGEYVCNVDKLPTYDELQDKITELIELEEIASR